MAEGTGRKSLSWIVTIIVLAVCGALGYNLATRGPTDPTLKEHLTPEGGLKSYAKIAYDFQTKELDFNLVGKVITQDDWTWFQDNYKNLHEDFLNLSGGLHPMEGDAVARISVMRRLFSYGPSRYDIEIMNSNVSGNRAEFTVRQLVEYGAKMEMKVEVVKEGKYWKMKDFGGARQWIQKERSPLGEKKHIPKEALAGDGKSVPTDPEAEMYISSRPAQPVQPIQSPMPTKPPPQATPDELSLLLSGGATPTPAQEIPPQQTQTSVDPVAQADALIQQANQDWQNKRFADALTKATQALGICKKNLGDNHPKTGQVQLMVDAAKKQMGQ
jgi:hypothetical protein